MIAKKLKRKIGAVAAKAPGMSKPLPATAVKPMTKLQGIMQGPKKPAGLRKKMY